MSSLLEKLTSPEVRSKVVQSCVELVDNEVASKGGVSGMLIKTSYKAIKALRPGLVPSAVDGLLPEFAYSLQGLWDKSTEGAAEPAAAFTSYLTGHPEETADALLAVTDRRAEKTGNSTLKKAYERLRGLAKDNVANAVPRLATTLGQYL